MVGEDDSPLPLVRGFGLARCGWKKQQEQFEKQTAVVFVLGRGSERARSGNAFGELKVDGGQWIWMSIGELSSTSICVQPVYS